MRPALASSLLVFVLFAGAAGCAAIIGASFGDAKLGSDAGIDAAGLFDASAADAWLDPHSVNGLALWLDATQQVEVSGPNVTRWRDLSGNGRDGIPAGGGSMAPTVSTGINGRPTLHFVAQSWQTLVTPWAGPGGSTLTIFVVAKGYPQSAVRFQITASVDPYVIFPFDDDVFGDAGPDFGLTITGEAFARVPVNAAQPQLLTGVFDEGSTITYNDGQLSEQHLPIGPSSLPQGQTLYIGGALPLLGAPYTASQFFDGDLGEILIYDTALSPTERTAIEAYLRMKWGI